MGALRGVTASWGYWKRLLVAGDALMRYALCGVAA
jgi:hypothetical protein